MTSPRDVEVRDRVYWKRVSSSASVDYSVTGSEGSWKFSGDDENESEAISLLFLADDPQLSDLVSRLVHGCKRRI